MIDRETLFIINEAIVRIENKDDNYTENPTWQRLRKVQDEAFKDFAKQEIKYCKSKNGVRVDRDYNSDIRNYEEFLNIIQENEDYEHNRTNY